MTFRFLRRFISLTSISVLFGGLFPLWLTHSLNAADKPAESKAEPRKDILLFKNGEKLIGKLSYEADGKVYFKSDSVGTVGVSWAAIEALSSSTSFAVLKKGELVRRHQLNFNVPVGVVAYQSDVLTVTTSGGERKIPVKEISYLVDHPTFEKNVLHRQNLWQGFAGTVTAGTGLVYSTQNSRSVHTSVSLKRRTPAVTWMPPEGRTSLDFSNNLGQITQPNTPTVKTNIVHGAIEQDEYFVRKFYLLQQAVFDHNVAQGLDLQQLYGFGLGLTAIKNSRQELDITATAAYTKQAIDGSPENDLISSVFGNNYTWRLPKRIVLTETGSFNPAWNRLRDYSANVNTSVSFPIFKGFGFTAGFVDSYLNNPATGFQGNSVQFNTGLSYSVR